MSELEGVKALAEKETAKNQNLRSENDRLRKVRNLIQTELPVTNCMFFLWYTFMKTRQIVGIWFQLKFNLGGWIGSISLANKAFGFQKGPVT